MDNDERQELIFLQSAHVTQYSGENGKSKWKVRKNLTSEDLHELQGDLTEAQVFEALDFARKFEMLAWNEGIQYGKRWNAEWFERKEMEYRKVIQDLIDANDRLAEKLGKFIGEEEEI